MSLTSALDFLTLARMLADAHFFNSRISRIEGAAELGPHIVEIVQNKTVAADPQSQPDLSSKENMTQQSDLGRTADAKDEQEKT